MQTVTEKATESTFSFCCLCYSSPTVYDGALSLCCNLFHGLGKLLCAFRISVGSARGIPGHEISCAHFCVNWRGSDEYEFGIGLMVWRARISDEVEDSVKICFEFVERDLRRSTCELDPVLHSSNLIEKLAD